VRQLGHVFSWVSATQCMAGSDWLIESNAKLRANVRGNMVQLCQQHARDRSVFFVILSLSAQDVNFRVFETAYSSTYSCPIHVLFLNMPTFFLSRRCVEHCKIISSTTLFAKPVVEVRKCRIANNSLISIAKFY
jgi:hypothetical protein